LLIASLRIRPRSTVKQEGDYQKEVNMQITTLLGLDYLTGWIHVFAVRRGWWQSTMLLGKDHRDYKPTVYFDGSVDWKKK